MALATYADLKAAVADAVARSDLTNQIVDAITLAEAIFNYGEGKPDDPARIDPIRTRDMETTASITIASESGTLPTDFLEPISVYSDADADRELDYITPADYKRFFPSGQSSNPEFYTIKGSTIVTPDAVSMLYYAKIAALSDGATTNWLLTKFPNIYLAGALYQLYALTIHNGERAQAYRGMMVSAMAALERADAFSRANAPARRASMVAF